jgi:hypothetical protein
MPATRHAPSRSERSALRGWPTHESAQAVRPGSISAVVVGDLNLPQGSASGTFPPQRFMLATDRGCGCDGIHAVT